MVPGGRSLPAALDRQTGKLRYFNFGSKGQGGSFVAADASRVFVHTRVRGTMALNLAYIGDAEGKPVSWNETRWVDEEFSKLLEQANGTLDVEERRKIFCKLEDIQMERGSIGIAYWRSVWRIGSKKIQEMKPHPNMYMLFNEVWLKQG